MDIDASFFKDFACCSRLEILIVGINTTSNGLPEAGFVSPLYEQDLPIRFMNNH
jgi:hypothetical protein